MFEKFLGLVERIADALEVIAAVKSGNDSPRIDTTEEPTTFEKVEDTAAAEALAKEQAAAKRKAAREKKAAEEKAAAEAAAKATPPAEDDLDPLGGSTTTATSQPPKEYTEKEVRAKLSELIDKEGRPAAFAILKDKGGGAKAFTDLKKEYYEDVYVAIEDQLAA